MNGWIDDRVTYEIVAVLYRFAYPRGNRAVQVWIPLSVTFDKRFGLLGVTGELDRENLFEQVADDAIVAVVVDAHALRLLVECEQALLEVVVPLHELHGLVRLLAARRVALQHAQYAARQKRA